MKTTTSMPLPLELTRPVGMASDLDTMLAEDLGTSEYNHETQMGSPEMWHHGKRTNSTCVNYGLIQIDDILQDFNL
ncbi:MAG TPA: hypothetical protein VFQ30_02060 [Ktedonobacteraceae bacterium]|nr:hypothetical protein [Ktedonobacteraceae bacterium]